ncbi:uncharacterized protein LOC144865599 isoform X2 [Branchiostoma floridae x Branchiostoma japonicum]
MSLSVWSRVSVIVFLLVATSCLQGAAEDAETDNKGDSTQTTDDEDSPDPSGDTDHLRKECCLQGRQAVRSWGSCPGKAQRYLKTVSLEDDKAKTCRLAFSGCCSAIYSRAGNAATTSDSGPGKGVKQLGGGPTTSDGDTDPKVKSAPQQPTGPYELRKSCCDRGHQSLRQEGPCQVKARKYVRTTNLGRSDAKLCRLLFGACCYRASRVAKPGSPKMLGEEIEGAEERQLGGTTPGEDEDQKATEPVWKRRLTARCCNAGKRSAAATSGSCASRARLMTRKTRFRSRRVQKKDSENCNQTFLRCCNEVPIV